MGIVNESYILLKIFKILKFLYTGSAEGGVPGVHVHPLFFGETPTNLLKNWLSSMPFVHPAPPVFSTLRRACGLLQSSALAHEHARQLNSSVGRFTNFFL